MPIDMPDLDAIFKAYDVRGTVPDQLDAGIVERIGAAFAALRGPRRRRPVARVLVGRDMRPSGVELVGGLRRGRARARASTSSTSAWPPPTCVYFAAGRFDAPGAPCSPPRTTRPQYNGIKLCLAGARPVGEDTGLAEIKATWPTPASRPAGTGRARSADATCSPTSPPTCARFVDVGALQPLKVVADTANGMGGLVVPAVFAGLPFDLEILYGELDGTFPNHPADPIQPENLRDLQARVLETGADVGLAFDGDADRVFLVDEQGELVSGSLTTAIVAAGDARRSTRARRSSTT